jgi:hypothetical protein
MNSRIMKKYIVILMSLLVLGACQKEWKYSKDISVNSTRLNITSVLEGEFYLPVFSNTSWTVSVSKGGDWLHAQSSSGEGFGQVLFHYASNQSTEARVAEVRLTASTGTVVTVYVVQAGSEQAATDIDDLLL